MSKYFTQFDESNQTIGTNLAGWTVRQGTDVSALPEQLGALLFPARIA